MDESGGTGTASRVFLIVPICSVKKRAVDYTLRQHVFIRMPTRCICINERSLMTPKISVSAYLGCRQWTLRLCRRRQVRLIFEPTFVGWFNSRRTEDG